MPLSSRGRGVKALKALILKKNFFCGFIFYRVQINYLLEGKEVIIHIAGIRKLKVCTV